VLVRGSSIEARSESPPPPSSPRSSVSSTHIRTLAKSRFLTSKEDDLLSFDDLSAVEALLLPPGEDPATARLSYERFVEVRGRVPKKARQYFTAAAFLSFPPLQPSGAISPGAFFWGLCEALSLGRARVHLQYYSPGHLGMLRECDVDKYISHIIHTLPSLHSLPPDFHRL
jgi:hypothetical protein